MAGTMRKKCYLTRHCQEREELNVFQVLKAMACSIRCCRGQWAGGSLTTAVLWLIEAESLYVEMNLFGKKQHLEYSVMQRLLASPVPSPLTIKAGHHRATHITVSPFVQSSSCSNKGVTFSTVKGLGL